MRRFSPLFALVVLGGCAGQPSRGPAVEMEVGRVADPGSPAPIASEPPPAPRHDLQAMIDGVCELTGGIVRCAGKNTWGEVGDGTRQPHPEWNRVHGAEGAVQLAAGGQHVCVRMKDGTARCWGQNMFGQLGDGAGGEPRVAPVEVAGLRDVEDLQAGIFHTCARLRNGDVLCWGGKIDSVQIAFDLDPSARLQPTRVVRGASALVLGHERAYAKTNDGWVTWAPQRGAAPKPQALPELGDVLDVAAGWGDECAITTAHEVRCWAASHASTSPHPLNPGAAVPIKGASEVVRVTVGNRQSCALTKDGHVDCWGQLFGPLRMPSPVSRVPGIANAVDVTAGFGFTCARSWGGGRGAITCFGSTEHLPAETKKAE